VGSIMVLVTLIFVTPLVHPLALRLRPELSSNSIRR
jgi:hypothetical protein